MQKASLRWIGLFLMACLFPAVGSLAQQQSPAWRFWELLDDNETYAKYMIEKAPEYHINAIQLSHALVHHAHQIIENPQRAALIRRLIRHAQQRKLKVFMWTHEFENVPDQFVVNGALQFDNPGLWTWLKKKYEKVFDTLPRLDGLVLTMTETDFRPNDEAAVISSEPPAKRLAKVANTIFGVAKTRGKQLIVRTFMQNPQQQTGWSEAIGMMDPEIIVMTKTVPYDWNPHFPDNPLLGAVAPHPQIVEFDLGQEYNGQSYFPFCAPDYYLARWRFARQKGVRGYVLRTERFRNHAMGTPNEVNLYAFKLLHENPDVTADMVWEKWATSKYGRDAAGAIISALKLTAPAVKKMLYIQGMWAADQSQIPLPGDFRQFVQYYQLFARQSQVPQYRQFAKKLLRPDSVWLAMALAEKDSAVSWARQALHRLTQAQTLISEKDYADLATRLVFLLNYATVFRYHSEVLLRAYLQQVNPDRDGRNKRLLAAASQQLLRAGLLFKASLQAMQMEKGREMDNFTRLQTFLTRIAKSMKQDRWLKIQKLRLERMMRRTQNRPEGVVVPMVTPFTHDNQLDEAALAQYTQWLCRQDTDVLFPMSRSGEVEHLTLPERKRIIDIVVTTAAGRRLVYPGVGGRSLQETLILAQYAQQQQADGIALAVPDFTDSDLDRIAGYLTEVAAAVNIPVMVYLSRENDQHRLTAAVMKDLIARAPNIRAVAFERVGLDQFWHMVYTNGDRIAVLSGSDTALLPVLASGGRGTIAPGGTLYPQFLREMITRFSDGQFHLARQAQFKVAFWGNKLREDLWPVSGKVALSALGLPIEIKSRARSKLSKQTILKIRSSFKALAQK